MKHIEIILSTVLTCLPIVYVYPGSAIAQSSIADPGGVTGIIALATSQVADVAADTINPERTGETSLILPAELASKGAELEAESIALQEEKAALDAEFMKIIFERDRLAKEKTIQGDIYQNQKYNDAVFRLKGRIAAYQQRCDQYEAKVEAFNKKIDTLR